MHSGPEHCRQRDAPSLGFRPERPERFPLHTRTLDLVPAPRSMTDPSAERLRPRSRAPAHLALLGVRDTVRLISARCRRSSTHRRTSSLFGWADAPKRCRR